MRGYFICPSKTINIVNGNTINTFNDKIDGGGGGSTNDNDYDTNKLISTIGKMKNRRYNYKFMVDDDNGNDNTNTNTNKLNDRKKKILSIDNITLKTVEKTDTSKILFVSHFFDSMLRNNISYGDWFIYLLISKTSVDCIVGYAQNPFNETYLYNHTKTHRGYNGADKKKWKLAVVVGNTTEKNAEDFCKELLSCTRGGESKRKRAFYLAKEHNYDILSDKFPLNGDGDGDTNGYGVTNSIPEYHEGLCDNSINRIDKQELEGILKEEFIKKNLGEDYYDIYNTMKTNK